MTTARAARLFLNSPQFRLVLARLNRRFHDIVKGLNVSNLSQPGTISQAPHDRREAHAVTAVSIILGILSVSLSVFTVGVYFYAKALWDSSGEPVPGYEPGVDFWGQWKVVQPSSGNSAPRITPIGGLVILSSPFAILAIICGLAAIICGVIAFNRYKQKWSIGSVFLGIGAVVLSMWLLSLL